MIESLQKKGRPRLAHILEKQGNTPLAEYSATLYAHQPLAALEAELSQAFCHEWQRMGYAPPEVASMQAELEKTRVLQTATHLTASEGPTFFAVHWLATLGLPPQRHYFVGAFSGIPFSNAAWSGCLNYSPRHALERLVAVDSPLYPKLLQAEQDRGRDTTERRIALIASPQRDALVFRAAVPQSMPPILESLQPLLQPLFPQIEAGQPYGLWALQCAQRISARWFDHKMVYFDLNEVMVAYLQQILTKNHHPLYRFFFEKPFQTKVLEAFGKNLPLFTTSHQEKGKEKWAVCTLRNCHLESPHMQLELTPPALQEALAHGKLCPGTFLTFTILSFINGFKCLGSFEQVEYLATFQEKWLSIGGLEEALLRQVPTDGLTTGRWVDEEGVPIFPLDGVLGTPWRFPEGLCLQDLLEPLLPQLLRTPPGPSKQKA